EKAGKKRAEQLTDGHLGTRTCDWRIRRGPGRQNAGPVVETSSDRRSGPASGQLLDGNRAPPPEAAGHPALVLLTGRHAVAVHLNRDVTVGRAVGQVVRVRGPVAHELVVDPHLDARDVALDPRADPVPLLAVPRFVPRHDVRGLVVRALHTLEPLTVNAADAAAGQVVHRDLVSLARLG